MHRRVVVAGIGAALLAPVSWLALREQPTPSTPPASADQRRAAELLAAVHDAMDRCVELPQDPAAATAYRIHTEQVAALEGVIGRAPIPTRSSGSAPAPGRKALLAAERQLVRQGRLMAVSTDDPDYAQLFSGVHASAQQLVAWFRDGAR